MIVATNNPTPLLRMNTGRGVAFVLVVWGWLSCVAFVFGAIEAQWLSSKDTGYVIVGFGILLADFASAAMYWFGWSLQRFFLTIGLAVVVVAICVLIATTADIPVFACSGILAAPILVHSAAICFWVKDQVVCGRRPRTVRLLRLADATGAFVSCLLGSALVSMGHMANLFARGNSSDTTKLAILFIEGIVGGISFWVLFGFLSSRIAKQGNEELRHHLEGWMRAVMQTEEMEGEPVKNQNQMRVFISYVRENLEEVRRICAFLEGESFAVIWDQNLKPGQNWREELMAGIRHANAVLVCFSEQSEKKKESEFYAEIREIVAKIQKLPPGAIFLIPVRLSECEVLPIRIDSNTTLNSIQRVDLFPDSRWNDGLQQITAVLGRRAIG